MLEVALYQPEIPPNTGNIARHCVGMNAPLHLIGPHRIDLSRAAVRRAGLDYWDQLQLHLHESPEAFLEYLDGRQPWLFTRFADQRFDQVQYQDHDILLFGSETSGLPEPIHQRWPKRRLYLPVLNPDFRGYNLANSVAAALTHAAWQCGSFDGF